VAHFFRELLPLASRVALPKLAAGDQTKSTQRGEDERTRFRDLDDAESDLRVFVRRIEVEPEGRLQGAGAAAGPDIAAQVAQVKTGVATRLINS
jgi:hypothetical protein